ncbi:TRAP transporter substrate-binding protein [Chloroflexota bacterium]
MKSTVMRFTSVFLSLALLLGFLGACAKAPAPAPAPKPAPAPTPAPAPAPAAEVFHWKMYQIYGVGNASALVFEDWTELIRKSSDGRLDIKVYYPGELPFKPAQAYEITRDRAVDVALASSATSVTVPFAGLMNVPFLSRNAADLQRGWATWLKLLQPSFDKYNVIPLGVQSYAMQQVFANKPITSFADLKGMKLRVNTVELTDLCEKVFQADPVQIATAEVYQSLQRGTVDGVITAMVYCVDAKLNEALGYALYPSTVSGIGNAFIINEDAFNELPEDLQQLLLLSGNYLERRFEQVAFVLDHDRRMKAEQAGMKITAVPDAEWREYQTKVSPVWSGWAERAGPEGVNALSAILEALGIEHLWQR